MQKQTKSLVVGLLVIMIIALGYFGVYGQYQNMQVARDAKAASQTTNDSLKQALNDVNNFIAKYQGNKSKVELAARALPVGDTDMPYILDSVADIANETGVTLVQVNVFSIADKGKTAVAVAPNAVKSSDFELVVRGTYEAYKNFSLRLENHLRLIDILAVNVTTAEDTGSQALMNFNVNLRAYYQQ